MGGGGLPGRSVGGVGHTPRVDVGITVGATGVECRAAVGIVIRMGVGCTAVVGVGVAVAGTGVR